jgi:hypothetical protein
MNRRPLPAVERDEGRHRPGRPRPELPQAVSTYEPWQHQRHQVTAGLTGFWQASDLSGDLAYQGVQFDINPDRVSFPTDFSVLFRAIRVTIRRTGSSGLPARLRRRVAGDPGARRSHETGVGCPTHRQSTGTGGPQRSYSRASRRTRQGWWREALILALTPRMPRF